MTRLTYTLTTAITVIALSLIGSVTVQSDSLSGLVTGVAAFFGVLVFSYMWHQKHWNA